MGTFVPMGDIIRLLPESVANQIAAGEVVQRPASAVKELLENAVDAGATEIKLVIKEAGKSLVQVIDNGCGMSERDARMCFERHATSKITTADDLLVVRTLGFRGEALASIASVAQVELKSKRTEDEVGTCIRIHGSAFLSQEPASCPDGTIVTVKHLFFNVPARRNFLKSNTLELKYIIEEFSRVAMAHPDISFRFFNQDKRLYNLSPSTLKQRLVALLGASYNQRLIPAKQVSQLVNISGFIGKPEYAKKTRGEQYFFTNGRFIKNPYLNHAVENAFRELIPKEAYPTYFLFLEVDPKTIDVNIHPTKTEINFQDAKSIYAILNSTIKQSIGTYNLAPTLDFEMEKSLDLPPLPENHQIRQPSITINPDYNPFEKQSHSQLQMTYRPAVSQGGKEWERLFDPLKTTDTTTTCPSPVMQVENRYLVTRLSKGIVVIDQQLAHQRILYEEFFHREGKKEMVSQKLLWPVTLQFTPDDTELVKNLSELLGQTGFEITEFGNNSFIVHAAPPGIDPDSIQPVIESVLESFKNETEEFNQQGARQLAITLARKMAIRTGQSLQPKEAEAIIERLMACQMPEISPDGKPTMLLLSFDELARKFKHQH